MSYSYTEIVIYKNLYTDLVSNDLYNPVDD